MELFNNTHSIFSKLVITINIKNCFSVVPNIEKPDISRTILLWSGVARTLSDRKTFLEGEFMLRSEEKYKGNKNRSLKIIDWGQFLGINEQEKKSNKRKEK